MKRPHTVPVVLLIAAVAVCSMLVAIYGYHGADNPTKNMTSFAPLSNDSPMNVSDATTTNAVAIENYSFNPSNITIHKGTTVIWTNEGRVSHTVTADTIPLDMASSIIDPNSTYMYTYNQTGSYGYHSTLHPGVTGTIVVTN